MRVNPKLYPVADEVTPYETQTWENRKVEIYLMDSFEGIKEEFVIKKGQFAVWSSMDGENYRLFLENGYFERVKELYTEPVNKIWLDFYDTTDGISRKFSNFFIYPLMGVAVIACVLSIFLSQYMPSFVSWIIIGVLAAMFVAMIFVNMKVKKVVLNENTKARQKIIDHFGGNRFDELIEMQKAYMDEYFENLYPEDKVEESKEDIETAEIEAPKEETEAVEEVKEENTSNEVKEESAEAAVETEEKTTEAVEETKEPKEEKAE